MKIGIDIMGGDYAPHASLLGCLKALKYLPDGTHLHCFGRMDVVQDLDLYPELEKELHSGRCIWHECEQSIEMHEHPTEAIKNKPLSSIVQGLKAHQNGEIDGFLSAGNTGAMLVGSVLILGKIKGIHRPTIGAIYPLQNQKCSFICDVGANMDCKPEFLVHFAVLATLYMKEVFNIPKPRVALLNVGEEKGKGNQLAKEAFELLEKNKFINFIGNAEGRDLNKHTADIYLCDGFVGNILLKFGESFYDLFKSFTMQMPSIEKFNFEAYGGTPFLGINGNVMIGHGISSPFAFENMIYKTKDVILSQLTNKITNHFQNL